MSVAIMPPTVPPNVTTRRISLSFLPTTRGCMSPISSLQNGWKRLYGSNIFAKRHNTKMTIFHYENQTFMTGDIVEKRGNEMFDKKRCVVSSWEEYDKFWDSHPHTNKPPEDPQYIPVKYEDMVLRCDPGSLRFISRPEQPKPKPEKPTRPAKPFEFLQID